MSVILCLYFFVQPSASLLNGYEAYLICVSARKEQEERNMHVEGKFSTVLRFTVKEAL